MTEGYRQRVSGEPILVEPGEMRTVFCCNCGLAHTYIYGLRKPKKKLLIEIVGFRNDWETNEFNRKNRNNK